ncbi:hypothetical protein QCA50_008447 [Cerrena zonata]|uniref:Uncharacterized protein n=1 Tax=Cerrena zonata TaxID=2478898 RepID=A0AAW0GDU5_9APHY
MDAPTSNSSNPSVPRQRSSPANDHSASASPIPPQQPYPYPVQQQQAGWNPAQQQQQQFYPTFYQNPHQQPYALHGSPHPPPNQIQSPYYDPANAQFAQWAYQQMMFNAHHQAHQMSHVPSSQRSRAGSASAGSEYFAAQGQIPNYNLFPSGTPPAHPSQLPNGYPAGQGDHHQQQQPQYGGFHPYRRPNRQGSHAQESSQQSQSQDWRAGAQQYTPSPVQPPYVRADASGSSTSVNSNSNGPNPTRPRTNSNQSGNSSPSTQSHGKAVATNGNHPRHGSGNSPSSSTSSVPPQRPHHRTTSSSSSNTSSSSARPAQVPSAPLPSNTISSHHPSVNLRKPSPLSQGTFTAAEKRMSRDDSDLAAMMNEPSPGVRSGGLKGRLRRALSLNAGAALTEEPEEDIRQKARQRDIFRLSVLVKVRNPLLRTTTKARRPSRRRNHDHSSTLV